MFVKCEVLCQSLDQKDEEGKFFIFKEFRVKVIEENILIKVV